MAPRKSVQKTHNQTEAPYMMKKKHIIGILVSSLLLIAGTFGQLQSKERKKEISEAGYQELFHVIMSHIRNEYVEEIPPQKLWDGAIRGMLEATGDPHTMFLDPELFRDLQVGTQGSFGGLGIEIEIRDSILTIVSPIEDTPAMRAGLKAGDRIVEIEGESTSGITINEAVEKLRGVPGTSVNITVARQGYEEFLKFDIVREVVKLQLVSSTIIDGKNIGYLKLRQFSSTAPDDIRAVLEEFKAKKIRGLIFDLRNNPGGLLDAAIEISNFFIDQGDIVSTKGRIKQFDSVAKADPDKVIFKDLPLVLLVNEGSASASEIVTGAIKDHKRGIIVGTKTFGKGSVQNVMRLSHDTGLKMTIQKYYTPSGAMIHGKGIMPDYEVPGHEFTTQEKRNYHDIMEQGLLQKFAETNKVYNDESVAKFKKYLESKHLGLSDYAMRLLLKQEINRYKKRDVYDLELDEQLRKAISLVK